MGRDHQSAERQPLQCDCQEHGILVAPLSVSHGGHHPVPVADRVACRREIPAHVGAVRILLRHTPFPRLRLFRSPGRLARAGSRTAARRRGAGALGDRPGGAAAAVFHDRLRGVHVARAAGGDVHDRHDAPPRRTPMARRAPAGLRRGDRQRRAHLLAADLARAALRADPRHVSRSGWAAPTHDGPEPASGSAGADICAPSQAVR